MVLEIVWHGFFTYFSLDTLSYRTIFFPKMGQKLLGLVSRD